MLEKNKFKGSGFSGNEGAASSCQGRVWNDSRCSHMKIDRVLENTTILKCTGCGLSDTRLNS